MRGRGGKQEFVIEQGQHVDARHIPGQGDQGRIQRAGAQLVDQAGGLFFMQIELEIRVLLAERAHRGGQHEGGDGRDGAQMERAGQQGAGALDRLDQGVGVIDQRIGARHRQFTGMGQLGAAGLAFGQFHPQQILQFLDSGGQGGLRHMARLGRPRERAGLSKSH